MKPLLLLAFLALGPALADQFPVTSQVTDPTAVAALTCQPPRGDAAAPAAATQGERAWLCAR